MSTERSRQAAGQRTGGQFKAEQHAEGGVELGVVQSARSIPPGKVLMRGDGPPPEWAIESAVSGIARRNMVEEGDLAELRNRLRPDSSYREIESLASELMVNQDAAFEMATLVHDVQDKEMPHLPGFPVADNVPARAFAEVIASGVRSPAILSVQPTKGATNCYEVHASGAKVNVRLHEDGTVENFTNAWQPAPEGNGAAALAQRIEHSMDSAIIRNVSPTVRDSESFFDANSADLVLSLGFDSRSTSGVKALYARVNTMEEVTFSSDPEGQQPVENDRKDVDAERCIQAHRRLVAADAPSSARNEHRAEGSVSSMEQYRAVLRDVVSGREPENGPLAEQTRRWFEEVHGRKPLTLSGPKD